MSDVVASPALAVSFEATDAPRTTRSTAGPVPLSSEDLLASICGTDHERREGGSVGVTLQMLQGLAVPVLQELPSGTVDQDPSFSSAVVF